MKGHVLALGFVILLAGCAIPQRVQLGPGPGDPASNVPGNKVVEGKEEPSTLVAVDGTVCIVTPARFDRIKAGDRAWCNWRPRGSE